VIIVAEIKKEVLSILSTQTFQRILNNDIIRIGELNAAIALLIKAEIPFDVEYSPGTRRLSPAAELTIYINPSTTINFTINFGAAGSFFGGGAQ